MTQDDAIARLRQWSENTSVMYVTGAKPCRVFGRKDDGVGNEVRIEGKGDTWEEAIADAEVQGGIVTPSVATIDAAAEDFI